VIEFNERVRRPDVRPQLFTGNNLAAILEQQMQDFEWLLLQLDPDASLTQLCLLHVKFEQPELQNFRNGGWRRHRGEGSIESSTASFRQDRRR
jgi:hypothetical protein